VITIGLTALAFYPIALFVWSSTQIHNLMLAAKLVQVDAITSLVNEHFKKAKSSQSATGIDRLAHLVEVQTKIQNQKEWPFDIYTLAPLAAAVLSAAVQGVLILKDLGLVKIDVRAIPF